MKGWSLLTNGIKNWSRTSSNVINPKFSPYQIGVSQNLRMFNGLSLHKSSFWMVSKLAEIKVNIEEWDESLIVALINKKKEVCEKTSNLYKAKKWWQSSILSQQLVMAEELKNFYHNCDTKHTCNILLNPKVKLKALQHEVQEQMNDLKNQSFKNARNLFSEYEQHQQVLSMLLNKIEKIEAKLQTLDEQILANLEMLKDAKSNPTLILFVPENLQSPEDISWEFEDLCELIAEATVMFTNGNNEHLRPRYFD